MTTRAKLTLCAALATALAALSLSPLFKDSFSLAPHGLLMITTAAAAGAGLRALPLPRPLVLPLQLLVTLYVLMLTTVQSAMAVGVLPGPKALDAVSSLLSAGAGDIQEYAIPAPTTDGLRLIVVGSVALVAVLVDALAVTYRRAAAAGLPLLALYSVGCGLAESPGGMWLWFLFASAGYLLLLYTEGQDRLTRWGRVFHGTGRSAVALSNGGRRVGLIALATAVLLPAVLPSVGSGLFGGLGGSGSGTGNGSGAGDERSLNLVVALTANLRAADDTELLRFSTDATDADQLYLRVAALSEFDGEEWKVGNQSGEPLPTTLPYPEGLAPTVGTNSIRTNIKISDRLGTTWLPMPYPVSWVELPSTANWRFDKTSRTVAGVNGQKTNGLSYGVSSVTVNADAAQLRAAGPAPEDITRRYLGLPDNLPPVVGETARKITQGATNPYDRAVALQHYFTKGDFTYNTKIEPRTGADAIAKFLDDKEGFCVHFAATMAAMSRSLGIPSRVAIGFTPGTGDSVNRVVRSSNYHAWPELYFAGLGWMRFEPTPNRGAAPLYSVPQAANSAQPSAQPSASSSADQPSAGPSASSACDNNSPQHRIEDCADEAAIVEHKTVTTPWWQTWPGMLATAGLVLLLILLATPMLLRSRLRRRRLGTGRYGPGADRPRLTDEQVLAAWAELVDSAWDLGLPPDEARTPRNEARRLAEDGRLAPAAAEAAGRIALATERVMFARESDPPPQLGSDVRTAREGLLLQATRRRRLRALLLPASTVRFWWRTQDRVAALRERTAERTARLREQVTRPFRRTPKD
ncbi:transglutaminase family protein [Kitasatospora sp. NPDC004531]